MAELARHLHAARAVRNKTVRSSNQARKRKRALREPALPRVAAAAAAAAPVIAAPKEGGGWKVVALDGFGWIKWNRDSGKMDAHCACHRGCKADRRVKLDRLACKHCGCNHAAATGASGRATSLKRPRPLSGFLRGQGTCPILVAHVGGDKPKERGFASRRSCEPRRSFLFS